MAIRAPQELMRTLAEFAATLRFEDLPSDGGGGVIHIAQRQRSAF